MVYIKDIRLENFESHKDTLVELSPGFNIFTGSSNSGKSSLIRGIRWLAFNEPGGDKFIRKDEEYIEEKRSSKKHKKRTLTKVTANLSNGYKIERAKNRDAGSVNRYSLWAPGAEEPVEFDRFGTEVPDEIRAALGFGYIKSGKNKLEVNYLSQFETPRALAYQGASLSNMINKLNNLDEFEEALSIVNSRIHARGEIPTKERLLQERLEQAQEKLLHAPDYSVDLEYLKNEVLPRINKLKIIQDKINSANAFIDKANKIKQGIIRIKNDLQDIPNIDNAISKIDNLNVILSKVEKSSIIIKKVSELDSSFINKENEINKLNKDKNNFEEKSQTCINHFLYENNQCPMCHQHLDEKAIKNTLHYLTEE